MRALRLLALLALVGLAAAAAGGSAARAGTAVATGLAEPRSADATPPVRTVMRTIHYRAHNGARRAATVLLPSWYGPRENPPLPLVISPHGRGLTGRQNARLWGNLPGAGPFLVISPDGQGRRLRLHSWGYAGQISDLARMPEFLRRALPWARVDRSAIYAVGGSMGGQETLLLLARHPRLLAGAAVFDAVTDLALQYRRFPTLLCSALCRARGNRPPGRQLQRLARVEVGSTPAASPPAFAARSPATYLDRIAFSCVPLQLWYSVADRVVRAREQSGKLFWDLRRLNRDAPVHGFAGFWIHTTPMHARRDLPLALWTFGLAAAPADALSAGLRAVPPREAAECVPAP